MTAFLLAALIFLSGVSTGICLGVLLCYKDWSRCQDEAADVDYSGGL